MQLNDCLNSYYSTDGCPKQTPWPNLIIFKEGPQSSLLSCTLCSAFCYLPPKGLTDRPHGNSIKSLTNLVFEHFLLFHASGGRRECRCQIPHIGSPTRRVSIAARPTVWPLLGNYPSRYYFRPRTRGLSQSDMDSRRHKTILARMAFSTRKYEKRPTLYFRLRLGMGKSMEDPQCLGDTRVRSSALWLFNFALWEKR